MTSIRGCGARVLLTRRLPNASDVARWRQRPPSSGIDGPAGAKTDHYEAPAQVRAGEQPSETFARIRAGMLAYDIFPPSIVAFESDHLATVTVGATIVQRARFGPVALEGAVRVTDVWDDPHRAGFRYVTLAGHPERGAASFVVEQHQDGTVTVTLTAVSRAGTVLTRIAGPLARLVQRSLTRAALRRLTAA